MKPSKEIKNKLPSFTVKKSPCVIGQNRSRDLDVSIDM